MHQIIVNTLIYASEIGIITLGISLSYSILRFANFAHIQLAVLGAYLTYSFSELAGLTIIPATFLSIVLTGCIAILLDLTVFRKMRHASAESKMIAAWGIALLLRSIIAAIFSGSARVFELEWTAYHKFGAIFTSLDIAVVCSTVVAMVLLHQVLHRTRVGTSLRALASNFELAETRGIPSERMILLMWFISGAYAAFGGTILAIETQIKPNTDLFLLLPVFASATIGGLTNVFGAVIGAAILSFAQNLLISINFGQLFFSQAWYLPSQQRDFIAVAALVLMLLLRPHGIIGKKIWENR